MRIQCSRNKASSKRTRNSTTDDFSLLLNQKKGTNLIKISVETLFRCALIKDDAEEKRLAELLASKNPEDIALANEMIKTMYEQDS